MNEHNTNISSITEKLGMTESSLRCFFRNKINVVLVVNIIFFIFISLISINNTIILHKLKRKIDHRYYNITRTLEDTQSVEVETRTGRVIKHYEKATP